MIEFRLQLGIILVTTLVCIALDSGQSELAESLRLYGRYKHWRVSQTVLMSFDPFQPLLTPKKFNCDHARSSENGCR